MENTRVEKFHIPSWLTVFLKNEEQEEHIKKVVYKRGDLENVKFRDDDNFIDGLYVLDMLYKE